jgi:hypothetical protein
LPEYAIVENIRNSYTAGDQPGVDAYCSIANATTILMESEFGASRMKEPVELSCFCCGEEDSSLLVAGANGAICKACTEKIYEHFENSDRA